MISNKQQRLTLTERASIRACKCFDKSATYIHCSAVGSTNKQQLAVSWTKNIQSVTSSSRKRQFYYWQLTIRYWQLANAKSCWYSTEQYSSAIKLERMFHEVSWSKLLKLLAGKVSLALNSALNAVFPATADTMLCCHHTHIILYYLLFRWRLPSYSVIGSRRLYYITR